MKVSLLKRLEAIEIKVKKGEEVPPLIMIHYNKQKQKWCIRPFWPDEYQHKAAEKFGAEVDRLQDYYFPAEFTGRVLLDAMASPDPDIQGCLFSFKIDELREGKAGDICIEKILENEGSRPPTAHFVTGRKDGQNV